MQSRKTNNKKFGVLAFIGLILIFSFVISRAAWGESLFDGEATESVAKTTGEFNEDDGDCDGSDEDTSSDDDDSCNDASSGDDEDSGDDDDKDGDDSGDDDDEGDSGEDDDDDSGDDNDKDGDDSGDDDNDDDPGDDDYKVEDDSGDDDDDDDDDDEHPATPINCADLGFSNQLKFEDLFEGGQIPADKTATINPISIYNFGEKMGEREVISFKWSSTTSIDAMIIFAANKNIVSTFTPPATSGQGTTTGTDADNQAISHITFCWNDPKPISASIVLVKEVIAVNGNTVNKFFMYPGDIVTYAFTVTNSGDVTLSNVVVRDPFAIVSGTDITLAPGESDGSTFFATYSITIEDLSAGLFTNTATVTGIAPNGEFVSDQDSATVEQALTY